MIAAEIRKLLQRTATRVLLLVLVAVNLITVWNLPLPGTQRGSRLEISDILSLYAALPGDATQALGALNQQKEMLHNAAWSNTDTPLLTADVYQELGLFSYVIQRVEQVATYDSVLLEIDQNAETLLRSALYEPDTFGYRNILESRRVFQELNGVQPQCFYSGAVELLPGGRATDLMLVLLCLLVGLELICTERTAGTMELIRPTFRGSLPLMRAKIVAGLLVTALGVLILYGANLLVGVIRCGSFPLNAPVQSVFGFTRSPWRITVGGYIAGFFGMKLLWAFAVTAMVYAACGLGGSALKSCGIFLMMLVPSVALLDSPVSLLSSGDTVQLFAQYRNLNLLGYPVSQFFACVVAMAATVLLGFSGALVLHLNPVLLPTIRIPRGNNRVSTSLFLHEARKLLIHQGALWVILGLAAVQFITYYQLETHISLVEHRYMQYSETLAGAASDEKDQYIAQEEARFASLYEKLAACASDYAAGLIDVDAYASLSSDIRLKLECEEVFIQAKNQYEQMKAMGVDYVCLTPYEHLLGWEGQRMGVTLCIKMILTLILGLAPIHAVEAETGMVCLLNAVPRKRDSGKCKRIIASLYAVTAALIAFVPQVFHIRNTYGLPGLLSDARSVPMLLLPARTVLGSLLIYGAMSVAAAIIMAHFVGAVSKRSGSTVTTVLLSSLLLLPVVLLLIW